MQSRTIKRVAVLATAATLLAGCATEQQNNTAVGTGVGAAAGAGIGALAGKGKGAAIGGAVGALAGGIAGYNWQAIKQKLTGATAGTGTQIAEQPDGSLKLNIPSGISFDTDSAAVTPAFAPVLQRVAQTIAQHPELAAQVVGYTDSTGSAAHNQVLSQNRAQSVAYALNQYGVAPNRLTAEGRGDSLPVASNDTAAGRAKNRRVEILLHAMQ
ncbi:OmpA family protein [Paraburkholderia sp. BR14263]|uniref:OmpA family protein n=1 Tax=unclassified Paraburkholderia TaxID=2615204 RepID=UPI0034CDEB3F